MVTALLGKKLGMTRMYDPQGTITPVTVIQAGPCTVLQVKTVQTDGYHALQLGFGTVKSSRQKQPQIGHARKAKSPPKAFVREVRLGAAAEQEVGNTLTVEVFDEIPYLDVIATSKGRGFAGVVKRHGFKGQPASHGVERKHRSPGSIGVDSGSTGRSIKKGKRMAGHMGCVRCTSRNHQVVAIDKENHLIMVKGSVPGPRNGYVVLARAKTKG
ncbi:MAG: 50S ribosomal protein L3 [Sedimentisphaerales bacterium]|nr:50S ribosomal protein L3 [Sedimentisphaerales bacterium]